MYKINLHAHTNYSDGLDTPIAMASEAKELDFCALVITDHFYGLDVPQFMTRSKMKKFRKECAEIASILPIIIGIEVPFMGQEVLIFGSEAIEHILIHGKPSMSLLLDLKKTTDCGVILCHPGNFEPAVPAIDGFEQYNSGIDYFRDMGKGPRDFGSLINKPRWANSDAHWVMGLRDCHNIVDSKIETEDELIAYIKSGKQPEFYIKGK